MGREMFQSPDVRVAGRRLGERAAAALSEPRDRRRTRGASRRPRALGNVRRPAVRTKGRSNGPHTHPRSRARHGDRDPRRGLRERRRLGGFLPDPVGGRCLHRDLDLAARHDRGRRHAQERPVEQRVQPGGRGGAGVDDHARRRRSRASARPTRTRARRRAQRSRPSRTSSRAASTRSRGRSTTPTASRAS